jgi:hypothetical protein
LFEITDQIYAFVAGYVPCGRGCNGCCHYKVTVCDAEAQIIEEAHGLRHHAGPPLPGDPHGQPCPFLIGSECSIYTVRPFVCRAFVSLDASSFWCQPERCNTTEMTMLRCTQLRAAFEFVAAQGSRSDIRSYFPFGLRPSAGVI